MFDNYQIAMIISIIICIILGALCFINSIYLIAVIIILYVALMINAYTDYKKRKRK